VVRKTDINGKLVQFAWWALAIIVLTLVVTIRNRVLGIPLERDEGNYAYAGHLILQDIPPYEILARQSADSRRFITTTKTDHFFGDVPKSLET
jgi:hypothetical protein